MNPATTMGDVLSGNAPLKFELSMDNKTVMMIGVVVGVLIIGIVGAIVMARNI